MMTPHTDLNPREPQIRSMISEARSFFANQLSDQPARVRKPMSELVDNFFSLAETADVKKMEGVRMVGFADLRDPLEQYAMEQIMHSQGLVHVAHMELTLESGHPYVYYVVHVDQDLYDRVREAEHDWAKTYYRQVERLERLYEQIKEASGWRRVLTPWWRLQAFRIERTLKRLRRRGVRGLSGAIVRTGNSPRSSDSPTP